MAEGWRKQLRKLCVGPITNKKDKQTEFLQVWAPGPHPGPRQQHMNPQMKDWIPDPIFSAWNGDS